MQYWFGEAKRRKTTSQFHLQDMLGSEESERAGMKFKTTKFRFRFNSDFGSRLPEAIFLLHPLLRGSKSDLCWLKFNKVIYSRSMLLAFFNLDQLISQQNIYKSALNFRIIRRFILCFFHCQIEQSEFPCFDRLDAQEYLNRKHFSGERHFQEHFFLLSLSFIEGFISRSCSKQKTEITGSKTCLLTATVSAIVCLLPIACWRFHRNRNNSRTSAKALFCIFCV